MSGFLTPVKSVHKNDVLCEMARVLRPAGLMLLEESFSGTDDTSLYSNSAAFTKALKFAGFVDIVEVRVSTTKLNRYIIFL